MSVESIKVADLIVKQKSCFGAFNFGVIILTEEYGMKILEDYERRFSPPMSVALPKMYESKAYTNALGEHYSFDDYSLDLRKSLEYILSNPGTRFDFLANLMATVILVVGDAMAKNGFFSEKKGYPEEFQFMRHIRNGIAHGNKFKFDNGQPTDKVSFKQFTIDSHLNGMNVLLTFDEPYFIDTGDVFELLDVIEGKLRNLS